MTIYSRKTSTAAFIIMLQATVIIMLPAISQVAAAAPLYHNAHGIGSEYYNFDPAIDSLVLTARGDAGLYFDNDILASARLYSIWQDTTFRSDPASGQFTVTLGELNLTTGPFLTTRSNIKLEFEKLALENIKIVSYLDIMFKGQDKVLDMSNSSIEFNKPPLVYSDANWSINILSGDNYLTGFDLHTADPSHDIILNISPGATLTIKDSFIQSANMRGTIDGGTLEFLDSSANLYIFPSKTGGEFHFINGAHLKGTYFNVNATQTFRALTFDNSKLTVSRFGSMKTVGLTLTDSIVNLPGGAILEAVNVEVLGTVDFYGAQNTEKFIAETLTPLNTTQPPSTVNFHHVQSATINFLYTKGITVNLGENTKLEITGGLRLGGGTINVNSDSRLFLSNITTTDRETMGGSLNLAASATMIIKDNAAFALDPGLSFNTAQSGGVQSLTLVEDNGRLGGSGEIAGRGLLVFQGNGTLQPGDHFDIADPDFTTRIIGTITTDADIAFDRSAYLLGDPPVPDGYFDVDVAISAGTPQNDQLLYGDGNVDISMMKALRVNVLGQPTASDMNNQMFTVMAAQSAGKSGTIINVNPALTIEESADVPALIDFSIIDLGTNGHVDITLLAEQQGISHIAKHPLTDGRNHKGAATLLVNAATSGPAPSGPTPSPQNISNALNTLTNGQLPAHLHSIHAEPYSSNMTIALEQTDMVINVVLGKAGQQTGSGAGAARFSRSKEETSGKRVWVDVNYTDGQIDGKNGLGDFDYSLTNLVMGADVLNTASGTAGAYFAYGTHKMDEHDLIVQDFSSDAWHGGIYFDGKKKSWTLAAMAGVSHANTRSVRVIQLGAIRSNAHANFDSQSAYMGIRATAFQKAYGWGTLSPQIGFNYTFHRQQALSETGNADLGLMVGAATAQAIITSAGLNARFNQISKNHAVHPVASLRYEHDWYARQNNEHNVEAALVSNPGFWQDFAGQNRGEDAAHLGLGLSSAPKAPMQIQGGLTATKTTHGTEWSIGLNAQYRW